MESDKDPFLEELFATPPPLATINAEQFCEKLSASVARYQRRRRLFRLGVEIAILVVAWLLSEPLAALAAEIMPWMMTSLVDTGDGLAGVLLAPVNSPAGVVAFVMILVGAVYRRFLRG